MHAKDIIDRFGGQSALAAMIGKGQSTVAYWAKTGLIPTRWQGKLLELANQGGIDLSADDFMGPRAIEKAISQAPTAELDVSELGIGSTALESSPFLFYRSDDGVVNVQVLLKDETVWASQRGMSEIFGVDVSTINQHLKNIYQTGELESKTTIGNFPIVQKEGERLVRRETVQFYNLDAIISVGYRVNSYQATQFRRWATGVLKSYLIKGFALDDDRLKQGKQLFGKDYFDELLERIREIRSSERRFYQKITDIFAQCSVDYDPQSPSAKRFYAHVQDKLHFAIHGHTSAELIDERADATKPFMGLTSWKNEGKGGKVTKLDVIVGKNYLNKDEIDELDRLVSMYLDVAELAAKRQKLTKMEDWEKRVDAFLEFNAYEVLQDFGKVRRETAERHALAEYEKFRVVQDKDYKSDFDKVIDSIKIKKRLPKPEEVQ